MARGTGRVEWGCRGGCCPGPCSGSEPWAAGRAGPGGHTDLVMPGCIGTVAQILPARCTWVGQCLWASQSKCPVPPALSVKAQPLFLPSQRQEQLLASQSQLHRLSLPTHPLGALSGDFLGGVSTWKRVQALSDPPPYLHTGAHPAPAVPQLLEMPAPAGRRSALRPAQIYPLFYMHTPLIFTVLLERYPGLLITPAPRLLCASIMLPPRCQAWGRGSAGMRRLVWWHLALWPPALASPFLPPPPRLLLLSSRAGHPVLTHKAAWVRVPLHPAGVGGAWLIRVPKPGASLWWESWSPSALVCVPREGLAATPEHVCERARVPGPVTGAGWECECVWGAQHVSVLVCVGAHGCTCDLHVCCRLCV